MAAIMGSKGHNTWSACTASALARAKLPCLDDRPGPTDWSITPAPSGLRHSATEQCSVLLNTRQAYVADGYSMDKVGYSVAAWLLP